MKQHLILFFFLGQSMSIPIHIDKDDLFYLRHGSHESMNNNQFNKDYLFYLRYGKYPHHHKNDEELLLGIVPLPSPSPDYSYTYYHNDEEYLLLGLVTSPSPSPSPYPDSFDMISKMI